MWTPCTSVTDRQTDGQTYRITYRITITKTVQRRASHGRMGVSGQRHVSYRQWRSQRGSEGPRPPGMRKNIKANLVNLTVKMRYTNDKQYQICHHQIRFFQAQYAPKSAYDAPPDLLVGPLPIPLPARRLQRLELGAAPRFSGPLNTKSWLRQWLSGKNASCYNH